MLIFHTLVSIFFIPLMTTRQHILWADDEIDLLKPHILFLNNKGYEVTTVTNGRDAIDALSQQPFSLR